MPSLWFFICLVSSVALVIGLVLLAVFPIGITLTEDSGDRKVRRPRAVFRRNPRRTIRSPAAYPVYDDFDSYDDEEL